MVWATINCNAFFYTIKVRKAYFKGIDKQLCKVVRKGSLQILASVLGNFVTGEVRLERQKIYLKFQKGFSSITLTTLSAFITK